MPAETRVYRAWANMKARCYNPNRPDYKHYGGRGIKVCERWLNNPTQFRADMGEPPKDMTLERINTNKDYSPKNCRWATRKEQGNNKRNNITVTIGGHTETLTEWCRILNRNYGTVRTRIYVKKWTPYAAVTTPTKTAFDASYWKKQGEKSSPVEGPHLTKAMENHPS